MEHETTPEALQALMDRGGNQEIACTITVHGDARGSITHWGPVVDPAFDYSSYGPFECWQWMRIVEDDNTCQVVPTGEYGAWNREHPEQLIVFSPGKTMSARDQALWLCRLQNGELIATPEQLEQGIRMEQCRVNPLAKHTRIVEPFPGV